MYKIVFSATGRTEKCADAFCVPFENITKIDLSGQDFQSVELSSEDFCLIAVPVYGGRVPAPAVNNIGKIKANGAKATVMVSYGNRAYDDALTELKAVCEKVGFQIIAACAVVAQHSLMPLVASDRPNEKDKKALEEFAVEAAKKSAEGKCLSAAIPGSIPKGHGHNLPVHPKATKSCIKCGLCAKQCPVKAIPISNPNLTIKDRCITCMRCVEICPQHSRVFIPSIITLASPIMKKVWGSHTDIEFYI